jgi:hypothetical protein
MSTLYLLDSHNPTINSSRVVDVVRGSWSNVPLNGKFPVLVPDDVNFAGQPANAGDLSTAKYAALLARYPGFENISYDDFYTEPSVVPYPSGNQRILQTGDRVSVILGGLSFLQTPTGGTSLIGVPTSCVVLWDTFSVADAIVDGRDVRQINEESPDDIQCEISFDAGTTFMTVTYGVYTSLPSTFVPAIPAFMIRMTNLSGEIRYLGGWALVY